MPVRVYLETNIFGGYLRDRPAANSKFRDLKGNGYRYYASTDVISELATNSDRNRFLSQFSNLRELVSDDCYYRSPSELIGSELDRFHAKAFGPLLEPRHLLVRNMAIILQSHSHPVSHKLRKRELESKKEFFQFDKDSTRRFQTDLAPHVDFPATFPAYWQKICASRELERLLGTICAEHSESLSEEKLKKLASEIRQYKAIYLNAIQFRLLPYSRAMGLQKPDRGDSVDIRHAVAAAYCDLLLTHDEGFRNYLKIAGDLLPFRVMSPDEFLALPKF